MTFIEHFVKERNEALFSLDRTAIEKYFRKCGIAIPENETLFWATVFKCICNITNAPDELVITAEKWLLMHGMSPCISVKA
jgi:NADPH-dependent 7-cyano-7-deazaguanine reductase QueF